MPQPHDPQQLDPQPAQDIAPGLTLSLIIPAYNESQRLPPYLKTIREYICRHYQDNYEVLIIDDGSTDNLPEVLAELASGWGQLRTLRHGLNLGKGAAVRTGVMAARGNILLYADADGATPIDQEQKLRQAIEAGADVAVGSRLLPADGVKRIRTWQRALIGRSFALAARMLLRIPVRDTQCGFKMLRATAGKRLFHLSQEKGYLFDLEILALAQHCGYRVTEVPINWADQPGSRLKMHRECCTIVADMYRVRRRLAALPRKGEGGV